jgi:hypothetical protein
MNNFMNVFKIDKSFFVISYQNRNYHLNNNTYAGIQYFDLSSMTDSFNIYGNHLHHG